jgi:hypothetical protein
LRDCRNPWKGKPAPERAHLIVVPRQACRQLIFKLFREILTSEESVKLARDTVRAGRLLQDDVDNIFALEGAGLA